MKTRQLYIILLLIGYIGFAQQPYYNNVDLTKTGLALKTELATKITNTHTTFLTYTPGIWEASKATDFDPTNPSNVILIYGWEDGSDSDFTNDRTRDKDATGGANDGSDWNREHTYPRSLGNPNLGSEGPGSDAHHLRPSDVQRNGSRGNKKFADGAGNSGTTSQGDWYPGDEWKGDVARMMMYMYLRYDNRCLPNNVIVGSTNTIDANMIDLLLAWNAEDPVSRIEINRNNYHNSTETYSQGNRNPFIDNPNLATQIWGGTAAEDRWNATSSDTEAPTTSTNLMTTSIDMTEIAISWSGSTDNIEVVRYDIYVDGNYMTSSQNTTAKITNLTTETTYDIQVFAADIAGNTSDGSNVLTATTSPPDTEIPTIPTNLMITDQTATTLSFSWSAASDNIGVTEYDVYIDNVLNTSVSVTNATIIGLTPETTYALSVLAKDAAGNTSVQSTAINGTTTMVSVGGESDLFISEYVEGGGFNKAIEIANFTDQAIDLSSYSVRRQANGAGAWESSSNLSGTLAIGEVFVIVNSDTTSPTLIAEADLSIPNMSPMTFNGNDPIGLFKNGVLIDIIGVFDGGSSNFAKDMTLRRKSIITAPNPAYDFASEWDSFPKDTVDNIGTHEAVLLEITEFNSTTFNVYPNPSDGNLRIELLENQKIEDLRIFDITGKLLLDYKNILEENNFLELYGLPKGILLVKITSNNQSITKKIVIK